MFSSDCVWQDLVCDFFHSRLDQRIHGGDGFVQVGKSDRVDMIFVDCDFYFQLFIAKVSCECRCPVDRKCSLMRKFLCFSGGT